MTRIAIEEGLVIGGGGGRTRVRLPRNDICRSCGLCLLDNDGRGPILEAANPAGAAAGDRVEVEIARRDPLSAAALLFGVPLLALLAGAGAGHVLGGDGGAIILGMACLAGAFLAVRRREKRSGRAGGEIRIRRVIPPPGSG